MNSNAPQKPENRPGLPQLTYRITDYPTSRKWLLSLLRDSLRPEPGNQKENPKGPLFRLTTRDSNDAAIALLDAWAVLADILTFYQERIANEGYLRTATERRSVLELARMIGYELAPGVAASTYFAFTVEDAPGSPEVVTIPQGTQVVSIPGEDELPQTFETSEEFIARVDWNNLKPRSSRPQEIWSPNKQDSNITQQLYFKGVNTQLKPGDFILLLDNDFADRRYLLLLINVEINAASDYTKMGCQSAFSASDVNLPDESILLQSPQFFAFRQTAFLFGHDAPENFLVAEENNPSTEETITWENLQSSDLADDEIDLNLPYPQILKNSWLVLYDKLNGISKAYQVSDNFLVARTRSIAPIFKDDSSENKNLAQISQVSRIKIAPNKPDSIDNTLFRSTVVLAQSEPLELALEPLTVIDRQTDIFQDPIQEKTVFLNEFVQKLHRDKILIVSGQRIRTQLNSVGGVFQSLLGIPNDVLPLSIEGNMLFAGMVEGVHQLKLKGKKQQWELINPDSIDKDIRALATKDGILFVGTANGVYQLKLDDEEQQWELVNPDSIDKDIRALATKNDVLFAATARRVYQQEEDQWKAVTGDSDLTNKDIRALVVENGTLFAETENGIYQWFSLTQEKKWQRMSTLLWKHSNEGFTNTQIQALVRSFPETSLLAGTTEGIFHSKDNGYHWEPVVGWSTFSKSLEVKGIQTLIAKDAFIFAGTAVGLFRSANGGETWQKLEGGLTYFDVRTIYLEPENKFLLIGAINGGVFHSHNNGDTWKITGLNHTDVQALTSQLIDDKTYTFAGTLRDGLFRCADTELLIWQPITDVRLGRGTVTTSGAAVMGDSGTKFRTELKQGDIIMVGEQSRTVLAITSDNKLTVDRPFRPDLTVNTPFTIETGLTTNRNMTALVAKEGFVFVGTAGSGVFCSSTEPDDAGVGTRQLGDRWTEANTGLLDLEIRCLEIDGNGDIWVGTSKAGVFRSTNNGNSWEPVAPPYSMNLDVRAILPPTGKSPNCFIGGIGILQPPEGSYPRTIQKGDILQLLERPASVSNKPEEEYRRWKLMDKDGFQGEFVTTTALEDPEFKNELTLLPALADGEWVSEVAVIQNSPTEQQRPTLTLQKPLQYIYDPATVRIYANVVPGTHGETIQEVLGSGEGHLPNQRFVLKKPPLTYVVAPNARGSASSLQVRVNRILWQEASSLYPLKPSDQNYIIRIQDDGTTIVTFGDGIKGARLPSGLENITATYRSGIGLDGNLKAEQLSILKTRPLGISEVINPLPATGGAPRESLTEAQVNAPATVRTLDRIVSIRDFEDFAQGFAGIGKAQAVPLWNGETQLVHITVAGFQGNKVLKDSSLYTNLVAAIDHARDPVQQVQIDSYERLLFNLEARFLLNPRYEAKLVTEKIRATLKTTFAFEKRKFGQDVTASEVIAAVQSVEGVIAVDLDALYQVGRSKALVRLLPALAARYDAQTDTIFPAQLLSLNLEGTQFTVVSTL